MFYLICFISNLDKQLATVSEGLGTVSEGLTFRRHGKGLND